jgi:hypothetical protein
LNTAGEEDGISPPTDLKQGEHPYMSDEYGYSSMVIDQCTIEYQWQVQTVYNRLHTESSIPSNTAAKLAIQEAISQTLIPNPNNLSFLFFP